MSTHKISIYDYEIILFDQDYKCYSCSVEHSSLKKGLFVDHCHTTGKVRGLLCNSCNSALGYAKDNITVLANMIKYLERC